MSVISAIRDFVADYDGLENDNVKIDSVGPDTVEYSIVPLPGQRIVTENIDGSSVREYPFAFRTSALTLDDGTRLVNSEFSENFAAWLESQTAAGTLPTLGTGQTATSIEETLSGALYEEGESGQAIYQIQCKLVYEQTA